MSRVFRNLFGRRPPSPPGIVLLYHRIADLAGDPQRLAVSRARFAEHLAVIAERGVPTTVEGLVDLAHEQTLPAGAVAVTFDDGYADNLHAAAPLLVRAKVPATVFVSTAPLKGNREFWWDEIEGMLLAPGTLPGRLRLTVGGDGLDYDLSAARTWDERDCAGYVSWTVENRHCPTPRHRVYVDLCRRLRRLPAGLRDRALTDLASAVGAPREVRGTHRPLAAAEVTELASVERITIGSHTDSHPSLAGLPADEQRREIVTTRSVLESLIRDKVTAFAYPFGGSRDFTEGTVSIVRETGLTLACSARPGGVNAQTDRFQVPRFIVRNWSKAEFLEHWTSWTSAS